MGRVLDRIAAGPALWLDDADYSERLLANGHAPWQDAAAYLALRRKAQGLLQSDVVAVPLARFVAARVQADAALREAMAAKKRAVAPARTLLADEALRGHLVEIIKGLRVAFANVPLVLALPSPRAWVGFAYRLAFGNDAQLEVGADEADACAVYVAEFLRSFGECELDGVLLEEDADAEPANAEEIGWYQPVLNLATHYRWDLGLRLPSGAGYSGEAVDGISFVIAATPKSGAVQGQALGEAFWNGEAVSIATALRYARVPADAVPERVLERLAVLRT